MLGAIRKFSTSIVAKIVLFFVAIPFVFWGMGPLFTKGNLNTIFKIGQEKVPTQEFVDYIKINAPHEQILDTNLIGDLLSNFIGEKLMSREIENFRIHISDNSLASVIKNQEMFKKNKEFSRVEYENFLVTRSLSATTFEDLLSKEEGKKQMLDLIGGGVVPSNFLIASIFDEINQKRTVQIINLNNLFKKKINISEDQIINYFEKNKDSYKKIYKSIKFIKLDPKNLTEDDEFNDLFFNKIDEIDDLIVEGKNIDYILEKFNLQDVNTLTLDKLGKDKNLNENNDFPNELIKNAFNVSDAEPTVLTSHNDTYYIFEVTDTESIIRTFNDEFVKKDIKSILKQKFKRKLISELIAKINNNNFNKFDFDKLSEKENLPIKQIKIENQNDHAVLNLDLVNQIYAFSEKKVMIATDIGLSESYLVYIDSIENVSINKKSKDYDEYLDLSKIKIVTGLYNTYDSYLKKKYEIDINYKALESVNNYFR